MQTARRLFFASLFVLLTILSAAQDYGGLLRDLKNVDTPKEVQEFSKGLDQAFDRNDIRSGVDGMSVTEAVDWLETVIIYEQFHADSAKGVVASPQKAAVEIKQNPDYRDQGVKSDSNWLGEAIRAGLIEVSKWLERLFGERNISGAPAIGAMSAGIVNGVIILLAILVAGGIIYFLIKFRWAKLKRVKAGGGLLEEDEPDRSADEWLVEADRLAAVGEHRRAVRCLFLASLLRLDEAKVARFLRGETNWEHHRRIMASPRRPADFDFTQATQRFDVIWYGMTGATPQDTAEFRQRYQEVLDCLARGRAA